MFLRMVSFNGKWIALSYISIYGFPRSYSDKRIHLLRDKRYAGSIPGWERSLGEENGNLLQHSCLKNLMDRGARWLQSTGLQRIRHDWATAHTYRSIYMVILLYMMTLLFIYTQTHIYVCIYMFLCSKFMPKYVASLFLKIV